MGFLSRLSGTDGIEKGLAGIDTQIQQAMAGGGSRFVLKVQEADFPLVARNNALIQTVIDHVEERGLSVLGVDSEPWQGLTFLHIATHTTSGTDNAIDEDPWVHVDESDDVGGSEMPTGEVGAFRVLKKWASRKDVGSPFGPGLGLEDALRAIAGYIEEPTDVRLWGRGLALDLAREHQSGTVKFDNWDAVMGCTSEAFDQHRLSKSQGLACKDSLNDAKRVVIEMLEQSGPSFDRWAVDDQFALCSYVIQQIAYLRLGAIGLLDIIDL